MKPIQHPEIRYFINHTGGVYRTVGNTVFEFNHKIGEYQESEMTLLDLAMESSCATEGVALDMIDRVKALG